MWACAAKRIIAKVIYNGAIRQKVKHVHEKLRKEVSIVSKR
jgi:hypothetical protein